MVTVMMPVWSDGYVNRLKVLPLPLDAKRYGPRDRSRNQLAIFVVRACLPAVGKVTKRPDWFIYKQFFQWLARSMRWPIF